MHKIIKTTDEKYLGRLIDINNQNVLLNDFIFKIAKVTYRDDIIELSNGDYIIEVELINELKNKEETK